MTIIIEIDRKKKYLEAYYMGPVSDNELIESWKGFYESGEWIPGIPEFIDLSALDDNSKISPQGIKKLSEYCRNVFINEGLDIVIVSVYAPNQYSYSLMKSYQRVSRNSASIISIFNNRREAKSFIEGSSHATYQHKINNMSDIFDVMKEGVCIISRDYEIQYANPILRKEFGGYKNKKCYQYFCGRDTICTWCKNIQVLDGKTMRKKWYSQKTKKTYDLIDTSFLNPDGSLSVIEIFRDISDITKK